MNYPLIHSRQTVTVGAAIIALMLSLVPGLGSPVPAAAVEIPFPAGTACDFELLVEVGEPGGNTKQFFDKDGNLVAELFAGTGSALVFTNVETGATLSLKGNGAVMRTTYRPDGSISSLTIMGHNVLFLFPTDVPAGPSTTLIVGRAVVAVDPAFNFTVQQISGSTSDICAALGG